MMGKSD